MTGPQLRRKLGSSAWRPLREGVYREGWPDQHYSERVLVETLRTDGVASHRSAARLLGIDRVDPFEGVELVTRTHYASEPGLDLRQVREPYFDVWYVERGIPVTTVPWTLAMLGAVAPPEEVEWAVDWAVRNRWMSWASLDKFARRHSKKGRRGFSVLRRVLDLRGPSFVATDSILETLYLQLLRRAQLPGPVQQFAIPHGSGDLKADFAFPEHKLIVETLGRGPHDPETRAFDDDRARVNTLRRVMRDWTVLEFTWNHVRYKQRWVATLTADFLGTKPRFRRSPPEAPSKC